MSQAVDIDSGEVATKSPKAAPQLKANPGAALAIARRVARKAGPDGGAIAESFAGSNALQNDLNAPGADRQAGGLGAEAAKTPGSVGEEGTQGGGSELTTDEKSYYGRKLGGFDLGGVRIHTDDHATKAANQLNAKAYAIGDNVVLSNPGLRSDKSLMLHELTHVRQNRMGGPAMSGDGGIEESGEGEAEEMESAERDGRPTSLESKGTGEGGEQATAPAATSSAAGPQRKVQRNRYSTGFTFSLDSFKRSHEYTLWPAPGTPPIRWPTPVPGVFLGVEPSVKLTAQGEINWREQQLSATLGIMGAVLGGVFGGAPGVCEVYGGMEAAATGGFEFQHAPGRWSLTGGIKLETVFRVGVKLADGLVEFAYEFGKCEIGTLVGLRWTQAGFASDQIGWNWGPQPLALFASLRQAMERGRRLVARGRAAVEAVANTGAAVYNGAAAADRWIRSWF